MLSRVTFLQLIRYGVIGVLCNLTGYILYLLITSYGGTPKLTITVLCGINSVVTFLGNKKCNYSAYFMSLQQIRMQSQAVFLQIPES